MKPRICWNGTAGSWRNGTGKHALIAKLNPIISKSIRNPERNGFTYNKDAGLFTCPEGHLAIRKARTGKKETAKSQQMTYYFDVEKCRHCPQAIGCYQSGAKSKTYSVDPMVRMHMGYARYDDLSSAYIADQWSKSGVDYTEYVCNIIDVKLAANEPVGTYAAHVLVGTSAYGTRIYARGQDGSWERVDTTGYCEASYNTGWAMKHYFSGQRV